MFKSAQNVINNLESKYLKYKSPFIKKIKHNKLSGDIAFQLIKEVENTPKSDLNLGNSKHSYVIGVSSKDPTDNKKWFHYFTKCIEIYNQECSDVFVYDHQLSVIHKMWWVNKAIHNIFYINPTNCNPFSFLTCCTNLSSSRLEIRFKFFRSIYLDKGEMIIFPSNFEYSYLILQRDVKHAEVLTSQVYLN